MAGGGGNEPNLTPLIDLFSVLIVFLLTTAAWTQLETFQIQVEKEPKFNPSADSSPPPPEPPKEEKKKIKLTLDLTANQIIAKQDEIETLFFIQGDSIDPKLNDLLAKWKAQAPTDQQIVISGQKGAQYSQLIKLYDLINLSGWENIVISPY